MSGWDDRYRDDVLAAARRTPKKQARRVPAERGLVIEDAETGFCGAVVGIERGLVSLEDRLGGVRAFRLGSGFLIDGEPAVLDRPVAVPRGPARTASGSLAAPRERARVALPSRILVEGRHDAELVEKVWGADLRIEGVVVESLGGVDDLPAIVAEFAPGPARRIGVLVDHLVPGSKESRIADVVAASVHGAHVLVVGHPFVDIWQAVKPERIGRERWPVIPRGVEWKRGVCRELGWPHDEPADIARAWQRILGRVRDYRDLEPSLLGRVEELIDFVTVPPPAPEDR